MIDIGKKIKLLRQNANVNQSEFAIKIGVHYQSVSKWERNLVVPDLSMFNVLFKFFNVSFEEFFEIDRDDGVTGDFSAEKISQAISIIRKNAGISQSEFAAKIDTNIDRISKWERGVTLPDIEEIISIAKSFDLPPSAIYYGAITQHVDSANNHVITIKNRNREIKNWLIASCVLFATLIVAICVSVPILASTFNEAQISESDKGQIGGESVVETPQTNELGYCAPILDPTKLHGHQELVHQSTLNQYVIHEGLDIVATVGENVYSMVTGKILNIGQDDLYNWKTVSIVDDYGLIVVYRYCKAKEGLKVGDQVNAGDIIGTVTKVSYYERGYPTHLHVEVYLGEFIQDPEDFFSVKPPETNYE